MKIFKSSNSKEVNIISFLVSIIIILIIVTLFYGTSVQMSIYLKIFITLLITFGTLYFYSNSLREVELTKESLILRKNIGKKIMELQNIDSIEKIPFSNLTSTISSQGFFGFNGFLMDNSITLINDRNKIVRVSSLGKKYLLSVDNPEELIYNFKNNKNYS